jgi:hypothetical protein
MNNLKDYKMKVLGLFLLAIIACATAQQMEKQDPSFLTEEDRLIIEELERIEREWEHDTFLSGGGDHDNWRNKTHGKIGGGDHDNWNVTRTKKSNGLIGGGDHDNWNKSSGLIGGGDHDNWNTTQRRQRRNRTHTRKNKTAPAPAPAAYLELPEFFESPKLNKGKIGGGDHDNWTKNYTVTFPGAPKLDIWPFSHGLIGYGDHPMWRVPSNVRTQYNGKPIGLTNFFKNNSQIIGGGDHDNWQNLSNFFNDKPQSGLIGGGDHDNWQNLSNFFKNNSQSGLIGGDDHDNWRNFSDFFGRKDGHDDWRNQSQNNSGLIGGDDHDNWRNLSDFFGRKDGHDDWRNQSQNNSGLIGGDDHDNWRNFSDFFGRKDGHDDWRNQSQNNSGLIGGDDHDNWRNLSDFFGNRSTHEGIIGGDDHDNWRNFTNSTSNVNEDFMAGGGDHDANAYFYISLNTLSRQELINIALSLENYHRSNNTLPIAGGLHDYVRRLNESQIKDYIYQEGLEHPEYKNVEALKGLAASLGNTGNFEVEELHHTLFRKSREDLERFANVAEQYSRNKKGQKGLGGIHDYIFRMEKEEIIDFIMKNVHEYPELVEQLQ